MLFLHTVSVSNLLLAWNEFKRGKRKKADTALFELHLENNIFRLHNELISRKYLHQPYNAFYICDPKRRHIHKAVIRDRVLHQAIFRILYKVFDVHFIYDSYSSRNNKGTHLGVKRLTDACRKETKNWRENAYVLKCDIKKFFDSIDHDILRTLIVKKVHDKDMLWLIDLILDGFEKEKGKALPLGNVTSQLFSNVYLNELDQFVKHSLKVKYYFRYCDDFVVVSKDVNYLKMVLEKIRFFLGEKLKLALHPSKIEIRKVSQGVDFLGYVVLPYAQILRTSTKNRIRKKVVSAMQKLKKGELSKKSFESVVTSYRGVLSHSRSRKMGYFLDRV